jgi:RHS repeat-associated protein
VSSVTTTFTYNGDGLRDSLTTGGNTTTFTWDVNRSIPQVLDDEDFRYVYGIGRISQVGASETHYYLSDGLGSTMALTDADGDVVNDYDYDVFGALRDSSSSQANNFTFAGEQVDGSTGLQYLRARYYDMASGRFLSTDDFPGFKEMPSSQNLFAYVAANPTTFIDPWGYCKLKLSWSNAKDCASDAGNAVVDVGTAVVNDFVEHAGPRYDDLGRTIQLLDLVPLTPVCAVGGLLIAGPAGAGVGAAVCETAEVYIGLAALYAGVLDVANSDCSKGTKALAFALVLANFGADLPPYLGLDYVVEYPIYRATSALIDCKE